MAERLQSEPTEEHGSRRKIYIIWIVVLAAVVLAILALLYVLQAHSRAGHFPEQTYINGIDVGGMSALRAKNALADQAEDYTLTVKERGGVSEYITAADIGLTYVDSGEVDDILADYKPWRWFFDNRRTDEWTASSDTQTDTLLMRQAVEELSCFFRYTPVSDAQLTVEDGQYVVQEAEEGTQLDDSAAKAAIREALEERHSEIDLDELGLYLSPTVHSDDASLNATADRLNGYLDTDVTLDFGDNRIVTVNADVIEGWISEDEDGELNLDYDLVYDFVRTEIAYKVDTFGLNHTVTTHEGYTLKLSGGDYGWCLSRGGTTDAILAAVEAGETGELEPVWKYKAQNLGYDDIGGTYVEISISDQTMWCYEDYELVVETPVVTGNVSRGTGTPYNGVWAIDGMVTDAVLGTMDTMGYESPVNYWMPFNENVGIHDADGWRSSYGGSIYLTNGSHGCVNTPLKAAKTIYETVTVGTAVAIYDLEDEETVIVSEPGVYEEVPNDDDWDWDD